jgi:predicted metalloendopeptidase
MLQIITEIGWCTITRDAAAKQRLKTDVHSPPFARVLGPLRVCC